MPTVAATSGSRVIRFVIGPSHTHAPVARAQAKLRYRSPAVGTDVAPTEGGFRLRLDEPAYGVAPGQAAVLYDDDAVVGAGTITASAAEPFEPANAFESGGE